MTIVCPSKLCANNAVEVLRFAQVVSAQRNRRIFLDASKLEFVDPFGLCVLAATAERIGEDCRAIHVTHLHPKAGGYLGRMDLFGNRWLQGDVPLIQARNELRSSLVELRCLTTTREVDAAANGIATALLGTVPGLDPCGAPDEMTGYSPWDQVHEPLGHVFTELLQNSLTHGRRNGYADANVWVSAQYYRQRDCIRLSIVDTGCGYLGSLKHHPRILKLPENERTHTAAILLALQPRISCNREVGLTTDTTNAGIGLTTAYRIVRQSGGQMALSSGDAILWISGDRDPRVSDTQNPFWQGVAIHIELKRQALTNVRIRDLMPPREIDRLAPPLRFE
jgi:hypothetical protein